MVKVPGWSHLPWLIAAFSTRAPGLSQAYGPDEQNLGWTADDDPAVVAKNRQRFFEAVTGKANPAFYTLRQVHSGLIHDLEKEGLAEATGKPGVEGDGLITTRPDRLLGILTADCVPVLLADKRTRTIAAFHAGWRGTLAGIVQRGVETISWRHGSQPEDLVAAIGPAIRPCCFNVGKEVESEFSTAFPYAAELFSQQETADGCGKLQLDLQEANRRQLLEAGLASGNITTIEECTACSRFPEGNRKYFSYRAETGRTGRMLSVIGVH